MSNDCKLNTVVGKTACACGTEISCISSDEQSKACVNKGSEKKCLDVVTAGYSDDKACALNNQEGTAAIHEENKICLNGILSAVPDCNVSDDCEKDAING